MLNIFKQWLLNCQLYQVNDRYVCYRKNNPFKNALYKRPLQAQLKGG